jgi:uncharacterized protein YndB with AHSA1/START domain
MGSTTHSIEVNAPLRVVYNQWTQFEEFPRFMEGVEEVRQDGPKRLSWKATIAGKDKRWEAEIVEQVPDQRIAWVSIDGTPNAGEVSFESLESELTLITLTMQYEPEGFLEKAGDVLGIPSSHVEGNLQRFRDFIEQRGKETGGWRGRIGEGTLGSNASAVRQEETGEVYGASAVRPEEAQGSRGASAVRPEEAQGSRGASAVRPEEAQGSYGASAVRQEKARGADEASAVRQEETQDEGDAYSATGRVPPRESSLSEIIEPKKDKIETARMTMEGDDSFPTPEHRSKFADHPADKPSPLATERIAAEEVPQFYRSTTAPTRDQIARRAYEIYLARGEAPGDAQSDWLEAEKELSQGVSSR